MTSVANDLFDTWSARDQVGVQLQVSILKFYWIPRSFQNL